jgi:hypothetical protein
MKNYGELKADIADWLDREDLTDQIPKFIKLAESKIYRRLRTRENEFSLSIDEATTPEPISPITLPDNFREFKLLAVNGQLMQHISSQQFTLLKGQELGGEASYFTVIERKLHLLPWPTEAGEVIAGEPFTLEAIYYGTESIGEMATWPTPTNPNAVPESDGTPSDTTERTDDATTRLLLVAPDVLLYGALVEAYLYLREANQAAVWKPAYDQAMAELHQEDALAEFSGSTSEISSVYRDGRY